MARQDCAAVTYYYYRTGRVNIALMIINRGFVEHFQRNDTEMLTKRFILDGF